MFGSIRSLFGMKKTSASTSTSTSISTRSTSDLGTSTGTSSSASADPVTLQISEVASKLENDSSLTSLTLTGPNVSNLPVVNMDTAGARIVAEGLKNNSVLESLRLFSYRTENSFGDDGFGCAEAKQYIKVS